MKYFCLFTFTLFLLVHLPLMAQDVMMVESEKYDDNMVNIAPVRIDDGYLSLIVEYKDRSWEDPKMNPLSVFNKPLNYNYVSDEGNVYLSKMDLDLNVIAQTKLQFNDAHDLNIYGMFHYEGKTSLYYSQRKNFSDEFLIFSMDIDHEGLKKNKARKIHTIRDIKGVPATRLIISPDSTKLAFISEKYAGNKDERKLDIALFNIQGTPIWSDPVYLGADTEKLTVGDAVVDNAGNIYVSYKLYEEYSNERSKKNKNGDRIPAYETRVVTYGIDETEAYVSLDDQSYFIRRCDLVYNPIKDKIQAIGTYSIKDQGNLTGVYLAEIDPANMTTSGTTFQKFDTKLIDLIDEDGFGQTKDKDPGVEVRDVETSIHIKENGDIAYIMQPYRYEEDYRGSGFNNRNRSVLTGYNSYSMIVAQFKDDGAIYTRIPRRSYDLSPYGTLFAKSIFSNDNIYLIYTDYHKNIERKDSEKPKDMGDPTRSSLILANIDAQGNYNRSFLKNRETEDNFGLSMSDFHAISNKEYMYSFYMSGLFSSDRQIGVVSF